MKLLLIGAGNMGMAMIKGLQQYDLSVVERNIKNLENVKQSYPHIKVMSEVPKIDDYIVVLAIKPNALDTLEIEGCANGVISILAGVTLKTLKAKIEAKSYVRAMPNMAALKQKSATSLCGDESLKDEAIKILQSIGKCFWLGSENELDVATGLAGSAPAWLALVAEALSDGAVNLGLKRDISYEMVSALFEGVGITLEDIHPALLKDKVTSPKGTTIAGVRALEKGGVRSAFIDAMEESYKRTQN